MKTTMSERGLSPLGFLGGLILIGVMVILTIIFINRGIGRGTSDIEGRFDTFADFDGDHVANFYDQCPCTDYGVTEHSQLRGCPPGTTASQSQENKQHFREKTCDQLSNTDETPPINSPPGTLTVTVDGTTYRSGASIITTTSDGVSEVSYAFECNETCTIDIVGPYGTSSGETLRYENLNPGSYGPFALPIIVGVYRFTLTIHSDPPLDFGIDLTKTG